jgi:TorA maturation chaperone TorD
MRPTASPGSPPVLPLPLLGDLARLRQGTYRLLADVFLYPTPEHLAALGATARSLAEEEGIWASFGFFVPWRRLVDALCMARAQGSAEGEYAFLFLVNPAAPPYESFYRDPQGLGRGHLLAQLARAYAEAGLAPSPSLGEPPDFLVMELEFMAFLCGQEARAWERGDHEKGVESLTRQRRFLQAHLGVWFPLFARRVGEKAPEGLYRLAAEAASAFLHHDLDLLRLLVAEVGHER